MSLRPNKIESVPQQTDQVAKAAFPKGNFCLKLRDELGTLYQNLDFSPLFSHEGPPALAPWRLALVSILQFVEGLTDRQAANMVRSRLDWKYLLGLELTDSGFDFSVLSEFRSRLLRGDAEKVLLDRLLKQLQEKKLLHPSGKQRTDSTHVLALVRNLNRLELLGETLRAALNALAVAAPEWLVEQIPVEWYDLYGRRIEDYQLPQKESGRQAWAEEVGIAGFSLLQTLQQNEDLAWLRELGAVEILRQVWLQQFWLEDGAVRLRKSDNMALPGGRIHSPYDPQARYATKREIHWLGYKVHLTESCGSEEYPQLITQVHTTVATTPDVKATATIEQSLSARDLLPVKHIVDAGYMSSQLILESKRKYQQRLELVGPLRVDASWQSLSGSGYEAEHFKIDWLQQQVECPQGVVSSNWRVGKDKVNGPEYILVRFARQECNKCEVREQCSRNTNRGRTLRLRPQAEYEEMLGQKQRQGEAEFKTLLDLRAGIEGTLSEGVRVFELRRSRYIGLEKTHLQHVLTAVGLNLVRIWRWLAEVPIERQRVSRLQALKPVA